MAFRSKTRLRRGGVRKKAIWVNIPFGAVAFTETLGNQLLLTGEDWEAQFTGLANESAVLRAIVGELQLVQTTVGTLGTTLFYGLYRQDNNATVVPAFTTSGMSEVDWLRVGVFPTAASVTATANQASKLFTVPVDIRAKRRITSRDGIFFCAQYGADVAAPAGIAGGLLRFLIARD